MYINAFILGGILCALFQIFAIFTKLEPPKVLILGFTLGALLTPYGMTADLADWGGAGLLIMVMNAGNAVASEMILLLSGNPMEIIITFGLFISLTLIGIVAGYVRCSVIESKEKVIAK
ncbi:MAG: SpoVA/SpoVAEb family sporulation membrane protein [Desulfitobacterium sp.]|nr:SpoVA/SpoVAEb family sporulation membrane protein [Desulfitobacterium sp.]